MKNRYFTPILRQLLIICKNNHQQFLLQLRPNGKLCLPLQNICNQEMFHLAASDYISTFNINMTLQGIIRIQQGFNGLNNFYRCIYLAKTRGQINNDQIVFKNYEEIQKLPGDALSFYQKTLLKDVCLQEEAFSLEFFRQNYKETQTRSITSQKQIKI